MHEIINFHEKRDMIIKMADMKPGQIGQIVHDDEFEGRYVRRIDSSSIHVVEDLSEGGFWDSRPDFLVHLLQPGERIIIAFYNEDEEETTNDVL